MTHHSRSFPFFHRERESLLLDLLCGAAGGALGTWLMSPVLQGVSKVMPQKLQGQGEQQEEGATAKLARKVLEPFGIELQGEQKKKAGNLVHYGYGIAWGAIYGVLHRRGPFVGKLFGLGFGLGLFLFGDEFLVPALKLGAPPQKTPLATHLSALAAHFTYGGVTEGSYRLLRRAFA
ncbi:DUF1440 domain-containing protein [Archangium violaceum]|uniref:DUF1440 domain-containing protein n=1 Tax=Archangium violaceum TaxID=83451 RepID=UPI00193AF3C6|nr:DUF1440 domain-containing protein [Archangium violaceum]QRK05895.1 DUF1440 domain-containing protein [Archangium violaceum]